MGQQASCCTAREGGPVAPDGGGAPPPRPPPPVPQYPLKRQLMYLSELRALWNMPKEDIDAFFLSHDVLGQERITSREDEDRVVDWYRVLNHFCALGNVEKMYIAPVIDPKLGNVGNQRLFEESMARSLRAGPGTIIMDLGCGKGRIAHEVATYSGAKVVGLNYDKSQLIAAEEFAGECGLLGSQLEFLYGSFNDPLPFGDAELDGGYEIGAFCYAIDKVALFTEIYRVLKPGGRFSYCDWCRLKYDPENEHHRELLRQVKPLTGMVEMPFPKEVEDAFVQSGFEVEFSGEASANGQQLSILVGETQGAFWLAEKVVNASAWMGVAPASLKRMWERIRDGGQALQEAVDLNLFSMSWQIIVRKPELPQLLPVVPAGASAENGQKVVAAPAENGHSPPVAAALVENGHSPPVAVAPVENGHSPPAVS